MTANVLASSVDRLVSEVGFRCPTSRCVRSVGSVVDCGRQATNQKNEKVRMTTDAHEDTRTMRCAVQNVSSRAPGTSGIGGGGDGSGGGGGGGVDGRGMEGGGVIGDGGGRGGGGSGLGDTGGRGGGESGCSGLVGGAEGEVCAITPTTNSDRGRHLMWMSNGGTSKKNVRGFPVQIARCTKSLRRRSKDREMTPCMVSISSSNVCLTRARVFVGTRPYISPNSLRRRTDAARSSSLRRT